MSNCVNSGIRQIGIATQYQSQSLIRHIHHSWGFLNRELGEFVEIWPAEQRRGPHWYRGTADAVFQNLERVDHYSPRYVLVLAADHVYRMNYGDLLATHRENDADVTIACQPVKARDARHFGIMSVARGEISEFREKPQDYSSGVDALASMGVYVFNVELLREMLLEDTGRKESQHDFGRDLIPRCVATSGIRKTPCRRTMPAGSAGWIVPGPSVPAGRKMLRQPTSGAAPEPAPRHRPADAMRMQASRVESVAASPRLLYARARQRASRQEG